MKGGTIAAIAGIVGLILVIGLAQAAITNGGNTATVLKAAGNDLTQFVYVSQGNKPAQL